MKEATFEKILSVLGKVIGNPVGYVLLGPVLVTGFGLAALPFFLSGGHENDHSGDASLPFALGLLGCGIGLAGGFILFACPLTLFLHTPFFAAWGIGYYLTLAGTAFNMWNR